MSNTLRDAPLAELSAPYWINSPVLQHGLGSCTCDLTPTSVNSSAALRFIVAGLVSGVIVVVLALAVMR
ncbi:hypothetical protein ACIRLA_36255 [Streptomyces sp. NPDC102364]|uniref:hypothetical protein n=1 Tax=Streptomyces sp. NPDC102364 TaxID=3366161 RepID=UPI003815E06D